MKLFFSLFVCVLGCTLSSCDPIYLTRSQPLSIKADSTLLQSLRVEGVSSVFPDVKHIYIESKDKTIDTNMLILLFYKNSDLLVFKTLLNKQLDKSIAFVKSKIESKEVNCFLVPTSAATTHSIRRDTE